MDAIVPAAGQGTRLRPLTDDKPKGMVEVDGTPLLEHCFDQLHDVGIDDIVVVVGYMGDHIVDYFGDEYRGHDLHYAEQAEADGIATAVLAAEEHVDGDLLVMLGDNLIRGNTEEVIDTHHDPAYDGAMLVEEVPRSEAGRYGVILPDDDGTIDEVVEKPDDPPSNLVATGFYSFTPAIFDACRAIEPSDRGEYEISDAINVYLEDHTIQTVALDGWRIDVGYPEDRERAEERVQAMAARSVTE